MAAQKSNYLRSKIVRHVINVAAYTAPATLYLALYTTDPTIADTGSEVTGGSYVRKAISFGTEANGAVNSNAAINFTSMPAVRVTHWGIRDASSGGNLMYFGAFDIPVDVAGGATFPVASGDLGISEL
jgi:hypothetical protein